MTFPVRAVASAAHVALAPTAAPRKLPPFAGPAILHHSQIAPVFPAALLPAQLFAVH